MRLDAVTIFPAYLDPLRHALLGKAIEQGILEVGVHDLRQWASGVHKAVDDSPYGGGPGMVMKPEVWGPALDDVAAGTGPAARVATLDTALAHTSQLRHDDLAAQRGELDPTVSSYAGAGAGAFGTPSAEYHRRASATLGAEGEALPVHASGSEASPGHADGDASPVHTSLDDAAPAHTAAGEVATKPLLIVPTPTGTPFTQAMAQRYSLEDHIVFACGRYEGIDARVFEDAAARYRVEEVSIGDYVLVGGEVAVLVMAEAIVRLVPGVLGNHASHEEDSFSDGLLEGPSYTKPKTWRGLDVPPVLLSGHHGKVAQWRREQSLHVTAARRPDLIERARANGWLTAADEKYLAQQKDEG